MRADESSEDLRRLLSRLKDLLRQDDLAAVIVHLNDTYLIEERLPELPGLARVARLIKWLRRLSVKHLREDRVLAVHAGDFLSPSYMSNTLKFKGQQIIELMNHCGIDYAVLGNHEFDFGLDALVTRLQQASFEPVLSNIRPRSRFPRCHDVALWPRENPFLAVLGVAGRATLGKAVDSGFSEIPLDPCIANALAKVGADPRLGAIVVLSHMDRDEDQALQGLIERRWPKKGLAYIFGGHDHDISWHERKGGTILTKNLANARSICVTLLTKSAVVAPHDLSDFVRPVPRELELEIMNRSEFEVPIDLLKQAFSGTEEERQTAIDAIRSAEEEHDRNLMAAWPAFDDTVESALGSWNRHAPPGARRDFVASFEKEIREAAREYGWRSVRERGYFGDSDHTLVSLAAHRALENFRQDSMTLRSVQGLARLKPDVEAANAVRSWLKKRELAVGADTERVVADLSDGAAGIERRLDATEANLRTRSTNFGNFVADAVRHATGADAALINAGSFRIDSDLSPRVTLQSLYDTFLYDVAGAIRVVRLSGEELRAVQEYAVGRAGSGAFLQVSQGSEALPRGRRKLRVAIVNYLLSRKSGDGYLELLSELRKCSVAEMSRQIGRYKRSRETLVELVSMGASRTRYCEDNRRNGGTVSLDPLEQQAHSFIEAIDRYLAACDEEGLNRTDSEFALKGDVEPRPTSAAANEAWTALRRLVVACMKRNDGLDLDLALYEHLQDSRLHYQNRVAYHRLLDYAWADVAGKLGALAAQKRLGDPS